MTINEQINRFCDYFSKQAVNIENIPTDLTTDQGRVGEHQIHFYQKILIITALDTLAGRPFPKIKYPKLGNRHRFISFIVGYSDWQFGHLVSLPFLIDFLHNENITTGGLLTYAQEKLGGYDPRHDGPLKINKFDEQILPLIQLSNSRDEDNAVLSCQHFSLFYDYRNYLVHESREPGYAMEYLLDGEPEAFYHGYVNERIWFLSYPIEFFRRLFNNSISGLKNYLIDNQIDPYQNLPDTTRWNILS